MFLIFCKIFANELKFAKKSRKFARLKSKEIKCKKFVISQLLLT
jgi:uncharacterized protein (DUF2147 family)